MQVTVDSSHDGVASDVKLAIFVEQRLLDVLLNDITTSRTSYHCVLNQTSDLGEVLADSNATSSICVFTRFDNPQMFAQLWMLVKNCLFATVCVLKQLLELEELWIAESFFDVKRQWQHSVVLNAKCLKIDSHVVVKRLFV